MSVFEYHDYKPFINDWIHSLPKQGRGELKRISEYLGVSTTMMSLVFRGNKHLNLELASVLAEYLALNEEETDFLFLLVEYQRAGSQRLKQKLRRKVLKEQSKAMELKNRLAKDTELSAEANAIFYSSWMYSGVRNLTALDSENSIQSISERLKLPIGQVRKVIEFLVNNNLCKMDGDRIGVGPGRTHIGSDNLLTVKHHQNWRIHGFTKMPFSENSNLFYTAPMSLSIETAEKIRLYLPSFIEKITKWVHPSKSETVRCLNIDWFDYT